MSVSVSLLDLLRVCVHSALAAQQFIALDLLKLPELKLDQQGGCSASSILDLDDAQKQQLLRSLNASVAVDVKSKLEYKEGEASLDLVTTADVLTQAVVVKALSTTFPELPFTIVGEEESDAADKDAEMAANMEHCMKTYYHATRPIPCDELLVQHLAAQADPLTQGVIAADSVEALRQRVSVYIDPIDGTNCFVTGVWQSPMTLVGITVDGEPVAAVMNRVFLYPIGTPSDSAAPAPCDSISYVWNVSPAVAGSSFMVHEGHHVPLHSATLTQSQRALDGGAVLRVTQSSTTKASFLSEVSAKLQPSETVLARGAGNKLFTLIEKTLADVYGVRQHRSGTPVHADVFICPGHTIKKWDTCAPQAFLRALGGEVYNHHGVPLRYPLRPGTDPHATEFTDLPDGLVATRQEAKDVVIARMGWPLSHC